MKLIHGDCIEKLKELEDNSVDSIVTDPPYGISFMGKKWDYDVPSVEIWKEVLRVLKPGGHALVACGTRTQHRMAVNLEDAGFEIRDLIFWVYSTGFPKSTNVFKQLQKKCTCGNMEVYEKKTISSEQNTEHDLRPMSETDISQTEHTLEKQGQVLQSELSQQSPHNERETSLAKVSISNRGTESSLERGNDLLEKERELQTDKICEVSERISGNGEEGQLHNGTQIDNGETLGEIIDEQGSSPSHKPRPTRQQNGKPCAFCQQFGTQAMGAFGLGSALKPAAEIWTLVRKPLEKGMTIADTFLKYGTGGININGSRVGKEGGGTHCDNRDEKGKCLGHKDNNDKYGETIHADNGVVQGRFPANLVHDGSDEVVELFPDSKAGKYKGNGSKTGGIWSESTGKPAGVEYGDSGSAARFFKSCEFDDECSLCYNSLCKDNNKEVCKSNNNNVLSVENNSGSINQTIESTALQNVIGNQKNKLVQLVKSVGSLCDLCATNFVQEVVVISNLDSSQEELQVMQDFTGNSKKCSLIQNLVQYVEAMDSIDTTQTTKSLLKLFGSANLAITKYIKETRKSEPKRLTYQAKASKSERNKGLDGFEEKKYQTNITPKEGSIAKYGYEEAKKIMDERCFNKNNHPTVKPVSLMRYLCKLITPKNGTVLDPFMGSGSTGIGAKLEGFYFIGIELDKEYFEIAKARINNC